MSDKEETRCLFLEYFSHLFVQIHALFASNLVQRVVSNLSMKHLSCHRTCVHRECICRRFLLFLPKNNDKLDSVIKTQPEYILLETLNRYRSKRNTKRVGRCG